MRPWEQRSGGHTVGIHKCLQSGWVARERLIERAVAWSRMPRPVCVCVDEVRVHACGEGEEQV